MQEMSYTKEELTVKIDEFIKAVCDGVYKAPLDYALIDFLKISPRTLSKYRTDGDPEDREKGEENIYKGYGAILKKLTLFREYWGSGQAMDNPKNAYYLFYLKQANNGGWSDRQEVAQTGEIKLQIDLKTADGKPYGGG